MKAISSFRRLAVQAPRIEYDVAWRLRPGYRDVDVEGIEDWAIPVLAAAGIEVSPLDDGRYHTSSPLGVAEVGLAYLEEAAKAARWNMIDDDLTR